MNRVDGNLDDAGHRSRRVGAYRVLLYSSADAAIADGELAAEIPTPAALPHRLDWLKAMAVGKAWWLSVRDLEHRQVAGYAVFVLPTRALPGHRLLRLERLRFAPDPGPAEAAVRYLADLARRDGRTVTLTVEPFFADEAEKGQATSALAAAGFRLAQGARMYTHTVRIDLTPEPEAIFAGFHPRVRRNVRSLAKGPVEIRAIQDLALAERLNEILTETFDRTAAVVEPEPWADIIRYCNAHPDVARLVALMRTDREGPEGLIAFALGLNHGDHVEYATAGSLRPPDLRLPFGYGLAWDLICWGRIVGAGWFDFGGIVPNAAEGDARQGIHDFKLAFGDRVAEVRQEWLYVIRPVREAWLRTVARLAARVRGIKGGHSRRGRQEARAG